jgi:hypothetical protein
MGKDIIFVDTERELKQLHVYFNMQNIVYYYVFINNKLYFEEYNTINGDRHNLFGAWSVYYIYNIVNKYYCINSNHIDVSNDVEFDKYVKSLVLQ